MAKAKLKKKTKRKSGKYNNARRSAKSLETQQLVLKTMVELLVKKRGAEVHIDEIARRSGISERSIFRFFRDKKALYQATDGYVLHYIQSTMVKMEEHTIGEFVRLVFNYFEDNEGLWLAYIYTSFGRAARARLRGKFNELVVNKIVAEKKVDVTEENRARLALVASLVNVRLWDDMRRDFDLRGECIGEAVSWAVDTLSDRLNKAT